MLRSDRTGQPSDPCELQLPVWFFVVRSSLVVVFLWFGKLDFQTLSSFGIYSHGNNCVTMNLSGVFGTLATQWRGNGMVEKMQASGECWRQHSGGGWCGKENTDPRVFWRQHSGVGMVWWGTYMPLGNYRGNTVEGGWCGKENTDPRVFWRQHGRVGMVWERKHRCKGNLCRVLQEAQWRPARTVVVNAG